MRARVERAGREVGMRGDWKIGYAERSEGELASYEYSLGVSQSLGISIVGMKDSNGGWRTM